MSDQGIKEGDLVRVDFASAGSIYKARVLQCPVAPCDTWILKEESVNGEEGAIIHVMMFEEMIKLDEEDESDTENIPF